MATDDYVEAHVRRLEAVRRGGVAVERFTSREWSVPPDYLDQVLEHERRVVRASPVRIQLLAIQALEQEATAYAPSWLDRQLRRQEPVEIANHGYGAEVRQAIVPTPGRSAAVSWSEARS